MRSIICFWLEKGSGYDAEPGALFRIDPAGSEHLHLFHRYEDGIYLAVQTPAGVWVIDGPGYTKARGYYACPWTRTGNPRDPKSLSVTPSINIGDPSEYHAVLTNGVMTSV